MAKHFIAVSIFLAASIVVSCDIRQNDTALAGSAPAVGQITIGPIPGGGNEPAQPTNPLANDRPSLQEGRKLFVEYNCSGCHGGHAGGGMGPSLRDPVWIYGNSDAAIFDSIARGRGQGMPAWGTKVPQLQIWQLVAYIKSLRTPQEPDPPE
jgi:cytochrome c oxidase cbb3-type subunit 3